MRGPGSEAPDPQRIADPRHQRSIQKRAAIVTPDPLQPRFFRRGRSANSRSPLAWDVVADAFWAAMMAILGAEHVMRWLPKGTHDWNKFITPDELFDLLNRAGLEPVDRKGFVFNPVAWSWRLSDRDLSVNYVTASLNPGSTDV